MNRRPLSDYRWYAIGFALARLMNKAEEESRRLRQSGHDNSGMESMYLYFRNRLSEHRQRMRRNIRYQVDSGLWANDGTGLMAAFAKIRSAIDEGLIEPIPGLRLNKGQNWRLLLGNEAYLKKMEEVTDSFGMFPSADKPTYIYPQFRDVLTQEDVAVFTPIAAAERRDKYDSGSRLRGWSSTPMLQYRHGNNLPDPGGNYKVVALASGILPQRGHCPELHGSVFCAIPKGVCAVEWFGRKDWYNGNVRYYVTDFIPCDVEFVDAEIRRY